MNQTIGNISDSKLKDVNKIICNKPSNRSCKNGLSKNLFGYVFIANLITLGFNLYFICNFYPRNPNNLGIDYIGVIIGILALLVTILITWQIFNTINANKKIEDLEKLRYSIKSHIITLTTISSERSCNTAHCIQNYISAIEYALMSNDEDALNNALTQLKSMCKHNDVYEVYKGEKRRYIKVLKQLDLDLDELIDSISKSREI